MEWVKAAKKKIRLSESGRHRLVHLKAINGVITWKNVSLPLSLQPTCWKISVDSAKQRITIKDSKYKTADAPTYYPIDPCTKTPLELLCCRQKGSHWTEFYVLEKIGFVQLFYILTETRVTLPGEKALMIGGFNTKLLLWMCYYIL